MNKEIEMTESGKKRSVLFALVGIFLLHFVFTCLTPLIFDDFNFVLSQPEGIRITGLDQVFSSMAYKYMHWSGRVVAMFFEFSIALLPVPVYSLIAALCYTLIVYLMAKIICKDLYPGIIRVAVLLWCTVICWGDVYLWRAGACNYLFTSVFAFLLLFLYERNYIFESKLGTGLFSIPAFFVGVLAGCSNENTAVALVAIGVGFIVYRIKLRNEKVPVWVYFALVGSVIGATVLLFAPGNYQRASVFTPNRIEQMGFIMKYLYRIVLTTGYFIVLNAPMLLITFIVMRRRKINKNIFKESSLAVYLLGVLATVYSLIVPPTLSTRSFMIVNMFSIIIFLQLLANSEQKEGKTDIVHKLFKILIIASIISAAISTCGNIWYYVQMKNNYAMIVEQRDAGIMDVKVPKPKVLIGDIHKCQIRVSAISEDSSYWGNQAMARAFGVNSITGVK